MSIRTLRRAPRQAPFVLVERTQHFRLIDGRWHRDLVLRRRADGAIVIRPVPEDEAAA